MRRYPDPACAVPPPRTTAKAMLWLGYGAAEVENRHHGAGSRGVHLQVAGRKPPGQLPPIQHSRIPGFQDSRPRKDFLFKAPICHPMFMSLDFHINKKKTLINDKGSLSISVQKNILPQFPHINKIKSDLSNQNFQVSNLSFPPLAQKFS